MFQEACCHNTRKGREGANKSVSYEIKGSVRSGKLRRKSCSEKYRKIARKGEQRVSIIVRRAKRSVASGRSAQRGETSGPWNSVLSVSRTSVSLVKIQQIARASEELSSDEDDADMSNFRGRLLEPFHVPTQSDVFLCEAFSTIQLVKEPMRFSTPRSIQQPTASCTGFP